MMICALKSSDPIPRRAPEKCPGTGGGAPSEPGECRNFSIELTAEHALLFLVKTALD
jgi:hypothetical protein